MKRARLVAFLVALAALGAIVSAVAAAAPPPPNIPGPPGPPGMAGHVYVDDNTAGTNTIAGYNRAPNGTLTPIPGSPFATGGAGGGHPNTSQGSLELSSDGRYLLAVDAGSNQISVLRIKPDGSLQIADVEWSGGSNPVSIAVHGSLVYVANQDASVPNYTGFTLNPGGHLTAIPGSTVTLTANSTPADVLFNNDGTRLVGTRVASSQIDSFTVGPNGLLTAAPNSPFAGQTGYFGQLGSVFSPTSPDRLYVTNAHTSGGSGAFPGTVSAYTDGPNGDLNAIADSPFAENTSDVAACWIDASHDGRFLYVVNTGSSTVSTFSVDPTGALTFDGSATIAGNGATDVRVAPDDRTLWIVEGAGDAIAGFSIGPDGSLTSLGSPTAGPTGATPSGIVAT